MFYKKVYETQLEISELMLPSHTNFGGKVHGGYILSMMDKVAFACASQFSSKYCVTASVDSVDFLNPVEVGQLVTMKAMVNHVGNSAMVIGIRVEAKNIQTGEIKHCNSSYFTMVAVENGKSVKVPRLILENKSQLRRFFEAIKRKEIKNEKIRISKLFAQEMEREDFSQIEQLYNIKIAFK